MTDTPAESPVIKLPEDPERVAELRLKLEEYQRRLNARCDEFMSPEQIWNLSKFYAVRILSTLLDKGEVVTWELARTMSKEQDGFFRTDYYDNYCAVIAEYIELGVKFREGT